MKRRGRPRPTKFKAFRRYADKMPRKFIRDLIEKSGVSERTVYRALCGHRISYQVALKLIVHLDRDEVPIESLCA